MITLIDYGVGNLTAFLNVYKRLHIPVKVASKVEDVESATKLILPGVGNFDYAMKLFNQSGLRDVVHRKVISQNTPILGICVGMQMLADSSEEGVEKGLGWIPGSVKLFDFDERKLKLPMPHMGWNDVEPNQCDDLYAGFVKGDCRFYFLHSYYYLAEDDSYDIASSYYGDKFCCSVNKDNIYGVQFHPEKSHHFGELLLKNFAEL